jgi:hypothetical protein
LARHGEAVVGLLALLVGLDEVERALELDQLLGGTGFRQSEGVLTRERLTNVGGTGRRVGGAHGRALLLESHRALEAAVPGQKQPAVGECPPWLSGLEALSRRSWGPGA